MNWSAKNPSANLLNSLSCTCRAESHRQRCDHLDGEEAYRRFHIVTEIVAVNAVTGVGMIRVVIMAEEKGTGKEDERSEGDRYEDQHVVPPGC